MATKVKTANQEFPIPDEWVALSEDTQEGENQRDARLKRCLAGYIPSISNAQLTYSTQGEETIVRVITQLGTKGMDIPFFPTTGMQCDLSGIHETLRSAPSYVPPVLALSWELKWLQVTGKLTFETLLSYQPKIQKALAEREPYQLVTHIHQRLKDLSPAPSPVVPLGF